MNHRVPQLQSVTKLYLLSEAFAEHGNPILLHSSFGYITDDYVIYFGQSKLGKFDLTLDQIKGNLEVLPDEEVCPKASSHLTTVSTPIDSNVHVKGPKLSAVFLGTGLVAKLLLQEAEILELLMRKRSHSV